MRGKADADFPMTPIRRVLTHPGSAHKDDFLACCVLLHHYPVPIERREPTEADLEALRGEGFVARALDMLQAGEHEDDAAALRLMHRLAAAE